MNKNVRKYPPKSNMSRKPKQWYIIGVRVVHIRSDRRHTHQCKTDRRYAEAHKGQSWMCQTRVFLGVR
jgi:hypothetical protein